MLTIRTGKRMLLAGDARGTAVPASQKPGYAGTAFHRAGLGEYAAKRSQPSAPPLKFGQANHSLHSCG
jgi:hypothetical protein